MKLYINISLLILFLLTKCLYSKQSYDPVEAERFFQYSRITYCQSNDIEQWTCPNCQAIEGVNSAFVVQDKHIKSQAYITYDEIEKLIIVAIRGTENLRNWLSNTQTASTNYAYCNKCKVHKGFYIYWKSISSKIIQQVRILKDEFPNYEILVTGHSLGGAVANFAALEIKEYLDIQVDHVITFGQPRVGNKYFQRYFNQMVPNLWRVTHLRDPVPHVPTKVQGFRHSVQEIYYNKKYDVNAYRVCSSTQGEDRNCISSTFGSKVNDHLRYYSQYTGCEDQAHVYNDDFDGQNQLIEDFSDLDEYFDKIIIQDNQYLITNEIDI